MNDVNLIEKIEKLSNCEVADIVEDNIRYNKELFPYWVDYEWYGCPDVDGQTLRYDMWFIAEFIETGKIPEHKGGKRKGDPDFDLMIKMTEEQKAAFIEFINYRWGLI